MKSLCVLLRNGGSTQQATGLSLGGLSMKPHYNLIWSGGNIILTAFSNKMGGVERGGTECNLEASQNRETKPKCKEKKGDAFQSCSSIRLF